MNRGTLGEDSASTSEASFEHRALRSINNPYNTTSNRQAVSQEIRENAVRGAARRKRKTPKKQTRALKEIRTLQKSTKLLIPRLPFAVLVREITLEVNPEITRYTKVAFEALQEATEMYIIQVLQDAYFLTLHRKCVTLSKGDLMLLRLLKLLND